MVTKFSNQAPIIVWFMANLWLRMDIKWHVLHWDQTRFNNKHNQQDLCVIVYKYKRKPPLCTLVTCAYLLRTRIQNWHCNLQFVIHLSNPNVMKMRFVCRVGTCKHPRWGHIPFYNVLTLVQVSLRHGYVVPSRAKICICYSNIFCHQTNIEIQDYRKLPTI